eukprot:Pompholyxophrys_punicea_v1_NODE_84_length_3696_cov_7.291678.p1 type:complete len:466 gc:universal NODE_84_length_3696_cov_7.291678:1548-2945(+)
MGVDGFYPFIKEAVVSTSLAEIPPLKIGIDCSSWLHKIISSPSIAVNVVYKRPNDRITLRFLEKTRGLIGMGHTPVLVFDGKPPEAKISENLERKQKREKALEMELKAARDGDLEGATKFFRSAVARTPEMANNIVKEIEIQKLNILTLTAPYEADLQLTYLCKIGFIDAVLGEDADFLATGCPRVLTKYVGDGRCESIYLKDVLSLPKFSQEYKFTEEDFRHMCILGGCDYFKIKGVGIVTAYNKIKNCRGDLKLTLCELQESQLLAFKKADLTLTCMPVWCPVSQSLKEIEIPEKIDIGCPLFSNELAIQVVSSKINPVTHEPWVRRDALSISCTLNRDVNPCILTEEDVDGASLGGKPPGLLTNNELQQWLRSRGLNSSGTRQDMISLVQQAQNKSLEIFDTSENGQARQKKLQRLRELNGIDYDRFPNLEPFPKLPHSGWIDETASMLKFATQKNWMCRII